MIVVDGRGRWQPIITREGWKPAEFLSDWLSWQSDCMPSGCTGFKSWIGLLLSQADTNSMTEAPIKIVSRWEFEHMDLNDYLF